eukprot:jgi/Tetstr1/449275/TSEL_036478.t1
MASISGPIKSFGLAVRGMAHMFTRASQAVHVENHNVAHIVDHGSRKAALNFFAKAVARVCAEYDIDPVVLWVPRTAENTAADDIAKYGDAKDRMLNPVFFLVFDRR